MHCAALFAVVLVLVATAYAPLQSAPEPAGLLQRVDAGRDGQDAGRESAGEAMQEAVRAARVAAAARRKAEQLAVARVDRTLDRVLSAGGVDRGPDSEARARAPEHVATRVRTQAHSVRRSRRSAAPGGQAVRAHGTTEHQAGHSSSKGRVHMLKR